MTSFLSMDALERAANWFMDMDWGWWPFLHLRPAKHESMTTRLVLKIALHFGPIFGGLSSLGIAAVSSKTGLRTPPLDQAAQIAVITTVFFFPAYRLTFAYFWNRRAQRLSKEG